MTIKVIVPREPLLAPKRGRGRLRKYPELTAMADISVYLQEGSPTPQFHDSRQKELNRLLEKGVFKIVKIIDVLDGVRLFNS